MAVFGCGGLRRPQDRGPSRSLLLAAEVLRSCDEATREDVVEAALAVLRRARQQDVAPDPGLAAISPPVVFPWHQSRSLTLLASLPGAAEVWPGLAERLHARAGNRWEAGRLTLLATLTAEEHVVVDRAAELYSPLRTAAVTEVFPAPDDVPGFRAWVHDVLDEALDAAVDVAEGRTPYRADAAFTADEGPIVSSAAPQALVWDEPWAGGLVARLLGAVAVAPDPAVRTVPSQSLAMGLGRAVALAPTPETVAALADVVRVVRHAGVKKKLTKHLATARRHLALRPTIAFRGDAGEPLTRAQTTTLARLLEGSWLADTRWTVPQWTAIVDGSAGALADRLVWTLTSRARRLTVMRHVGDEGAIWADADGAPVELPRTAEVQLWHPVTSDDEERQAWRERVWRDHVEQPFRQVFREHYAPTVSDRGRVDDLAGYRVDLRPFTGVARSAGWSLHVDTAARSFGSVLASFAVPGAYPGAWGETEVGPLVLTSGERYREPWAPVDDAGRVLLSEILRSVDLLVSVSALGLVDAEHHRTRPRPWGDGLALRREVVERAVADLPAARMGTHHLHVGDCAIHLRTGRITRNGAEVPLVTPPRPTAVLPWVPYDEKLLATILAAASQCAGAD